MEPFSLTTLAICFGGGIFGAALGGLYAFILCGLIIFSGCLVVLGGGSDFLLMQVGLGPIFGVHLGGFCSGVVAVQYAVGVRKNHPSESAKDILSPMMDTSWDVLVVGGITAIVSHLLLQVLTKIPVINMFDCIALDICILMLVARLIFLKEMPWGAAESIKEHGYIVQKDYSISWVPWMLPLPKMAIYGLGVGILSSSLAMVTKGLLDPMAAAGTITKTGAFVVPLIMGWSIAAITLLGLNFATGAIQKFPVWHCQAILSALAYLLWGSIFISAIVGVLAAFLQELMARMFYNHGSSHADPPALAIALGTFILNVINKVVV